MKIENFLKKNLNVDIVYKWTFCTTFKSLRQFQLILKPRLLNQGLGIEPWRWCLGVKNARVNPYKYSFFIRIVKEWNNLPQYVVEAESFTLIKAGLKSFLNTWLCK